MPPHQLVAVIYCGDPATFVSRCSCGWRTAEHASGRDAHAAWSAHVAVADLDRELLDLTSS